MKKYLLSVLAVMSGAALTAQAQVGGMVNQVDNNQTRNQLNEQAQASVSNSVPELYEGESSDVGPQTVVEPLSRHTVFQANVDEQVFYTDNALLTPSRQVDGTVLMSMATVTLTPGPYAVGNGTLAPRVGYQGQWVNYLNNPKVNGFIPLQDFNFSSQSAFADGTWTHDRFSFGAGLEAMRLFNMPSATSYDPIYDELSPYWMARYELPLCEKSTLSLSYFGDYRFTSIKPQFLEFSTSDASDRLDQGLLVACTGKLCEHLVFQPYYQFKYTRFTHFPDGSRNDYLNTVGAGLYWILCPNCSIRGYVNYDYLKSSISDFGYHNFDAGGGISLSVRF